MGARKRPRSARTITTTRIKKIKNQLTVLDERYFHKNDFFSNAFQSQKPKKQRISLTPGFYGGRKSSESQDADHEKITSILGVKDYSPFEKTERRARRNKENVSHNLVFSDTYNYV